MSNTKTFAFAGAAVVAMFVAGASFAANTADGGVRQMRPVCEFNTEAVEANVQTMLSDIGGELKLNAKQQAAFDAYVKVRAEHAAQGAQWRNKAYDTFAGAKSRQDVMKIRSEHRVERAAQFKKVTDARGAFVATLTPEQVEKFDAMEPGRCGMYGGHRGHGHRSMHGYGRGAGHMMGYGGDCGYGYGMGPHHARNGGHYSW